MTITATTTTSTPSTGASVADGAAAEGAIPGNLHRLLADSEMPWRFSNRVFQRFQDSGNTPSFKKVELRNDDPEAQFVQAYFRHSAPIEYGIKRIWAVHNPAHNQGFEAALEILESEASSPKFVPGWRANGLPEHRQTVVDRWKALTNQFSPFLIRRQQRDHDRFDRVRVMPLWHGTGERSVEAICRTGHVFFGKHSVGGIGYGDSTDDGFFGSGMYFTDSARYAAMYSRGRTRYLIMTWVAMREPFPVVSDKVASSTGCDIVDLRGKGAYQNYNSHFVPVVSQSPLNSHGMMYYPTIPGQSPDWDEVVLFQKAHTLPRFIIELEEGRGRTYTPGTTILSCVQTMAIAIYNAGKVLFGLLVGCCRRPASAGRLDATALLQVPANLTESRFRNVPLAKVREEASANNAEAQYELAGRYEYGLRGVSMCARSAERYYRLSAEAGFAPSQADLAIILFRSGRKKEAKEWAVKASNTGYERAFIILVHESSEDEEKVYWLQKGVSLGIRYCEYKLGEAYYYGRHGLVSSYTQAVQLFRRAIRSGSTDALVSLGVCYYHGNGVGENEREAVKQFRLAADRGNHDGEAWLARCYTRGHGVPRNLDLAKRWWKKVLKSDFKYDRHIAQQELGKLEGSCAVQ